MSYEKYLEQMETQARLRQQRGEDMDYDRHYTTPEELIEIEEREQRARRQRGEDMDYDRHYTTPEELIEIEEKEASAKAKRFIVDYRPYTSLEEAFGGPSDLKIKIAEERQEAFEKEIAKQEIEEKMDRDVALREEVEKYKNMPVGQRLHNELSYYAQMLKRRNTPYDIEMSKKVTEALSAISFDKNFEKSHELLEELKNNPETKDILPHWKDLVNKCEQLSKSNQFTTNNQSFDAETLEKQKNAQAFDKAKSEYKKNSWFNRIVQSFKSNKEESMGKGK